MVTDWKDVPDTPAWAGELLAEMEQEEATTVGVAHRQAEVQLGIRILTEQPPDVWEEWSKSDVTPMWLRSAIVEYSVAASRWAQVRQIAELELLDEILDNMIQDQEDDAS